MSEPLKHAQQKAGKYIAPLAPYGYQKDSNHGHRLIVDEQIRPIIENIHRWYLVGMGDIRIAKKLNKLGIASRSAYRKREVCTPMAGYRQVLHGRRARLRKFYQQAVHRRGGAAQKDDAQLQGQEGHPSG